MEVSNDILIDANNLRSNSTQKRQIREHTIEILRNINDELKTAHQSGHQSLTIELPIIFNITNMSEISARREVWSAIIICLKNKNYRVVINPNKDSCLLKITWFSKEDEASIRLQNDLIAMHTNQIR